MPFPIAAAVAAGASLLGSGGQALAQGNMNRKNRQFTREMYELQKNDELAFWRMNNNYNSPQEQMKRLQEAGLNPNLVYGNGATATSSGAPSAPSPKEFTQQAPNYNGMVGGALDAYFSIEMKQAQVDNLKVQNDLMLEDVMLKRLDNKIKTFDLGFKTDAREYDLDYKKYNSLARQGDFHLKEQMFDFVRRTKEDRIQMVALGLISEKLKQNLTSAQTKQLHEAAKSIQNDNFLKELDIDLKKQGVTYQDELWQRILAKFLSKFGITF